MPIPYLVLFFFLARALGAQTCLSLSTAAVAPGGTATLDLSFRASPEAPPSALQWTLDYSPAGIVDLTVDTGPAAKAAGKSVICSPTAAKYTCLVVGANQTPIPDGVVARLTATLARGVAGTAIAIRAPLGASAEGEFVPVASKGGSIITGNASPDRRLRPPFRRVAGARCGPVQ